MDFTEAIYYIQGHHEKKHLKLAEECIVNHLRTLEENNFEEIAISNYFLLSAKLQYGLAFETREEKKIYEAMINNFQKRKKELERNYRKEKTGFAKNQLFSFLNMIEGYFSHLHFMYDRHDFFEAVDRMHKEKMDLRFDRFWYERRFFKWSIYLAMRLSSMYGTSFFRWGGTVIMTVFIFGMLFIISDPHLEIVKDKGRHLVDYFYFSAVTMTTLGYGDITPLTVPQKIIAALEAIVGYIQLGILLILLQRKI